jgi:ribose transport system ATP-binding protein
MESVYCREQGVVQLDDFNISIFSGEIMGLLPVNQHGLTTLLRLLQHNIPLQHGYVYYREKQVNTWRASKQRNNRIGLIQSESCLVEGLTVADNLFVLRSDFKTWLLRPRVFRQQLVPFLDSIGITISADAYIEELSDFERVVVDVLKSVVAGCKLIVLRELSADICEAELLKIHLLLRHYAKEGISFLYIDYHFEGLQQICDKVALMSNGRVIKVLQGESLVPESLYAYTHNYIGRVKQQIFRPENNKSKDRSQLQVKDISGDIISGLSFSVSSGECVVLQNVDGHMFAELLSILSGNSAPISGEMLLNNNPVDFCTTGEITVIQELPTKSMIFSELSYFDNLCFLLDKRMPEVWRDSNVREGIRREYSAILGEDVFNTQVDVLEETQKYHLVYMRIALQSPKIVICVQPFRSADMEHRMQIMELMRMLLDKNIALVILTVNLADSLSLADRLIRIHRDKPEEVYTRGDFSEIPVSAPWVNLYRQTEWEK